MREIVNILIKGILLVIILFSTQANSSILGIGKSDAKVTVKVFSSLTCPHCASFHNEIFSKLENDFINNDLVRFEHHAFPLDFAALNAEIVVRCQVDNDRKFELLEEIYNKQKFWAVGSDINKINDRKLMIIPIEEINLIGTYEYPTKESIASFNNLKNVKLLFP